VTIYFASLKSLQAPDVVQGFSYESVLQAMRDKAVALFPDFAGFIDLESEPARIVLEVAAYHSMNLLARVNDAARANLLAFAMGGDLDQLGAFYDVLRLTGETDDQFRKRIVLEIAGRSPGGTAERYRAKAMQASVLVKDAYAWRDDLSPLVHVAVMSTMPGGVASQILLDAVADALNNPAVKMVNDTIDVVAAVTHVQRVDADIWLLPGVRRSLIGDLPAQLQAAWEIEGGIGRDLTRSWLTARLMPPGVQKVDIMKPVADVIVPRHEAAAIGTVTLTFRGRAS